MMDDATLIKVIDLLASRTGHGGLGGTGVTDMKAMVESLKSVFAAQNTYVAKHADVLSMIQNRLPSAIETAMSGVGENSATVAVKVEFDDIGAQGNSVVREWTIPINVSALAQNMKGKNTHTGALANEIAATLVDVLRGLGDQATLQKSGIEPGAARSIMYVLRESRDAIEDAVASRKELLELRAKYDAASKNIEDKGQLHAARKEAEMLKEQLSKMQKVNPECERYVEHIRHLNARIAALQQKETQFNKLKDDYEALLARYEMMRVQYVRVRTQKCMPRLPDFVAGLPHPVNGGERVVKDLYGTYVTHKETRRARGEDVETSDDEDFIDSETRTRMQARKRRLLDMLRDEAVTGPDGPADTGK